MAYVDGFVHPLPKRNLEAYRELARQAGQVWREYGALEYRECIGEVTSFPRAVELQPDELVIFAWIVFKSRAHRDEVNAKVMADPRIANLDISKVRFDSKRMIYGGFETFVEA